MEYIIEIINGEMIITGTVSVFALLILFSGLLLLIRIIDFKRVYTQKRMYFEVIPPYKSDKTPEAMKHLFHVLHNITTTQKLRYGILRQNCVLSFEIISTRHDGIRYVIGANERDADLIERNIIAFLSDAKVKRIDDPLFNKITLTKMREFKQTKHYALPIRTFDSFEQHDPIAYITGAMNKLSDNEQAVFQLVVSPARIRNMAAIVDRYREYYKISDAVHNKAYGHLFRSELRISVATKDSKRSEECLRGIESAVASLSIPKIQSLKVRRRVPLFPIEYYKEWLFTHRMPSFLASNSNIFSSLELAGLYHFPANYVTTDNLVTSLSRTLAPPLSVINNDNFDVILGRSNHRGIHTDIGLTAKEREKHVFIVGGTGNGKSTMLEYALIQDIKNGKGVALIDPHGDLAEALLSHIPKEREQDIIYFNPDDLSYPIGLNLLELTSNLSEEDRLREKDLVAESVVSIFRKIFSDNDAGGHRIEYILRNTIHTAFTVKNATLFTIYDLLNDLSYRRSVVTKLENKDLKNFWRNEMGRAGGMQQVKMVSGITAKIGRFLFSTSAKRILEQPKSTINFDEILNGKILICNFSKGLIGEDTSELFGIAILAKLQIAALHRARIPHEDRIPFYVYVDEFQNFATPSFTQMLSEARKYKLFLTMAEQSTSQQDDNKMVEVILANVGTVICFRSGSHLDEARLLPYFHPYLSKGDVMNLSSYCFYMRTSATRVQETFSGTTIILSQNANCDMDIKDTLELSRKNFAIKHPIIRASDQREKDVKARKITPNAKEIGTLRLPN